MNIQIGPKVTIVLIAIIIAVVIVAAIALGAEDVALRVLDAIPGINIPGVVE